MKQQWTPIVVYFFNANFLGKICLFPKHSTQISIWIFPNYFWRKVVFSKFRLYFFFCTFVSQHTSKFAYVMLRIIPSTYSIYRIPRMQKTCSSVAVVRSFVESSLLLLMRFATHACCVSYPEQPHFVRCRADSVRLWTLILPNVHFFKHFLRLFGI